MAILLSRRWNFLKQNIRLPQKITKLPNTSQNTGRFNMKLKNPFEILGMSQSIVREFADGELAELAKNNYRKLVMKHHPDKGGEPEKFSVLKEAYEKIDYAANPKSFLYMKQQ